MTLNTSILTFVLLIIHLRNRLTVTSNIRNIKKIVERYHYLTDIHCVAFRSVWLTIYPWVYLNISVYCKISSAQEIAEWSRCHENVSTWYDSQKERQECLIIFLCKRIVYSTKKFNICMQTTIYDVHVFSSFIKNIECIQGQTLLFHIFKTIP